MKPPPRRRVSSVDVQAQAYAEAGEPCQPPEGVTLRPKDKPFWSAIIAARLRCDWADVDLVHAANLARVLADVEDLQRLVAKEGRLVGRPGDRRPHPACKLLADLTSQSMQLTRMLKLHALIGTSTADQAARKRLATRAQAARQAANDGLLARPESGQTH